MERVDTVIYKPRKGGSKTLGDDEYESPDSETDVG